ncbi:hypothetical protein [Paenibacillus sp. Marseille-Q4541]|uniref:hypothetical protein n=1 Tax=Paenibacillus sp. Marseille-Q4541 TaxID=2831522 RepID=UPI001BA93E2C|nr:hypothetical protein [Paenibacillus sp. Marseille-Q4541]
MDKVFPKEAMLSINEKVIGMVRTDGRIIHKTANVGRSEIDFSMCRSIPPQPIEFTVQFDEEELKGATLK